MLRSGDKLRYVENQFNMSKQIAARMPRTQDNGCRSNLSRHSGRVEGAQQRFGYGQESAAAGRGL
jgi:hypothetical protein